ncbi:MAG: DUF2974 domain-containing protein [Clostridia bacterium]|nr:DUF2974 domain-containing protein [Clostridia bacterium]
MDSLRDYIGWMGDYGFDAVPFGDVDALVLCAIVYFDLSPLFAPPCPGETALREGLPLIERGACAFTAFAPHDLDYAAFLREAAASKRFGELALSDYVDVSRVDPPLQFAAVSFRSGDFTFLAFRGTDMTLAGWREDFMISFTATEAQETALQYAARHVAESKRCRLGGHSKGGNLALYAACGLDDESWARVERVYLLDSPGLCPELADSARMARAAARTLAVTPVFSVVGRLFEPAAAQERVIRSSGFSLLQHSLGSWGVDHGRLALAASHDPASLWIDEVLRQWIDGIPQERRAVFVNDLFDALAASGAVTLADILRAGPAGLRAIFTGLLKTSRAAKLTAAELPMRALLGESYDRLAARIFPKDSA